MKVLVCGGRDFSDYAKLQETLDKYTITEIIHGGARGADTLADAYATLYKNIPCKEYKADWTKYGKGAGFIRNQQMLDEEHPDMVIAFPGGAGTADMVRRSKGQGYRVVEVQ